MKGELPLPLNIFSVLSATFLTLSALALWGFATWKMTGKAKENESIHNGGDLWWFAWIVATMLFLYTLANILSSWLFITRGWHHKWAFQVHGNSMSRAEALDGIRAALRERISARPHDKSFALSGILKTYGVMPPTPDYTLTVGETCRVLFQTLLNWQPTALFMLLDAGGDVRDDCPSWVPNWETRTPNQVAQF
jgi:hypothetical protein